MGLGMWPDDPCDRVKVVVESLRGEFDTLYVADRAEVSEDRAQHELDRLDEEGYVSRVGDGKWQVNTDALDEGGLIRDEEEVETFREAMKLDTDGVYQDGKDA